MYHYFRHLSCEPYFVYTCLSPLVILLLTVQRWWFWICFVICDSCLTVSSGLFLAALWLAGKGLTSWLFCMRCFLVFMSFSYMMSWVRYSTLFLIFAFFLCVCLVIHPGLYHHLDREVEGWLLCSVCLPDVLWQSMFCRSSSKYPRLVFDLPLWYFLITPICFFAVYHMKMVSCTYPVPTVGKIKLTAACW